MIVFMPSTRAHNDSNTFNRLLAHVTGKRKQQER